MVVKLAIALSMQPSKIGASEMTNAITRNAMRAANLPVGDKSNIRPIGFDLEFRFFDGQKKITKDVSDLSAAIYQTVNAALTLDMAISAIHIEPIYGEK